MAPTLLPSRSDVLGRRGQRRKALDIRCESRIEFPLWEPRDWYPNKELHHVAVPSVTVFGREILHQFIRRHAEVRGQAAAWLAEAEEAEWKTPQDVRARYPSVSFIGDRRAGFDLKGKKYRLDTRIAFETAIVAIIRMGTHAEYADWKF